MYLIFAKKKVGKEKCGQLFFVKTKRFDLNFLSIHLIFAKEILGQQSSVKIGRKNETNKLLIQNSLPEKILSEKMLSEKNLV